MPWRGASAIDGALLNLVQMITGTSSLISRNSGQFQADQARPGPICHQQIKLVEILLKQL